MRRLLFFFLTCFVCEAQSVTVGVIGGGRVTSDVSSSYISGSPTLTGVPWFQNGSRFYDVGGSIEVGLPLGLSIEADGLYHRQGYFSASYHDTRYSTDGERDNVWEFPVLLKYKLRVGAVHPFVEAGVVSRTMTGRYVGTFQSDGYSLSAPYTTRGAASYSPSVGFVAGGGVEWKVGNLRLAPEVRYTRWGTQPIEQCCGFYFGSTYASGLNQVDVLVGVGWRFR